MFVAAGLGRRPTPQLGEVLASIEAGRAGRAGHGDRRAAARSGRRLAVWPDRVGGSLGVEGLDVAVTDDARGMLAQGATGQRHYGPAGERRRDEVTVFVESFAPPPRMLVFGAIDFAAAVARIGVVPRLPGDGLRRPAGVRHRAAGSRTRDEVVVEWPHRYLARAGRSTSAR